MMKTMYLEVNFLQGESADDILFAANDVSHEAALELAAEYDGGYDAHELGVAPQTLEEVESRLGNGWWSVEDENYWMAYHWNHQWVHLFRKVNS